MSLGRLFEPYVVQILPQLLTAFGDTAPEVREAVQDTSKVIMSKLRYGVAHGAVSGSLVLAALTPASGHATASPPIPTAPTASSSSCRRC